MSAQRSDPAVGLGVLIGAFFAFGIPTAFAVVEVIAATRLDGWLSYALWAIAAWNVGILIIRAWVAATRLGAGITTEAVR